jgi:hypothetical protein
VAFDPRKSKVKKMRAPGAITGSASIPAADNSAESLEGEGYDDQANEPGTNHGFGSEVGTEPVGIEDLIGSDNGDAKKASKIRKADPGKQKEETSAAPEGRAVNNKKRMKLKAGY